MNSLLRMSTSRRGSRSGSAAMHKISSVSGWNRGIWGLNTRFLRIGLMVRHHAYNLELTIVLQGNREQSELTKTGN